MNAFAIFAVNAHIETLLEEAGERRAAGPKPGLRQRVASLRDAIRDIIEEAAEAAPRSIPTTTGYPYQS